MGKKGKNNDFLSELECQATMLMMTFIVNIHHEVKEGFLNSRLSPWIKFLFPACTNKEGCGGLPYC